MSQRCTRIAERHHDPAQQDLCGEPERSAERLRDLFAKAFRSRIATCWPRRFLIRFCNALYRLSTAEGREVDNALLVRARERGFRLAFRRGRNRLPDDVSAPRRRLLLQRRLTPDADHLRRDQPAANSPTLATLRSRSGARLRDGTYRASRAAGAGDRLQEPARNRSPLSRRRHRRSHQGPVWGFDQGGELRNMWRRTAQPGLWRSTPEASRGCRDFLAATSRCKDPALELGWWR